jgi:hypothetical protein
MIEFYPTFTIAPDFSTPPVSSFSDGRRDIALAAAKKYGIYDRRGKRQFLGKWTITNSADVRNMQRIIKRNQGKSNPFYIPSWTQDLIVVNAAPAGARYMEIKVGIDYAVDLDPTKLDKFGTVVWFYSRNRELHVSRVIEATNLVGGNTGIILESESPFPIEEGTYAGFCIFAKQSNDTFIVQHKAPNSCEFELQLEEALHTLPKDATELIEGTDFGEVFSMPQVNEVRQTPLPISEKLTFETATVKGPEDYITGQIFPHQKDWLIEIVPLQGVRLSAEGIDPFYSNWYVGQAPEGAHIHGTFTIGGREHLCAGLSDGQVEIRFFDSQLQQLQITKFDGFSPLMINTWAIDGSVFAGESDIACIYLKRGEAKLFVRFAGGEYATEYLLCNSPVNPLYLTSIQASQGELLINGLDVTHNLATWVADVTPILPLFNDRSSGIIEQVTSVYETALLKTNITETNTTSGAIEQSSGEYLSILVRAGNQVETNVSSGLIEQTGGEYRAVLLTPFQIFDQDETQGNIEAEASTYFFAKPNLPQQIEISTTSGAIEQTSGAYILQ